METRSDRIPLEGKRFGHLTVLNYVGYLNRKTYRASTYLCRCDCGKEKMIRTQALTDGVQTTCGCHSWGYKRKLKDPAFVSCYNLYKNRSKKIKREFKLTHDEFRVLTQQDCYYCGCKPFGVQNVNPKYKVREHNVPEPYIFNGLDRIDSSKGYTIDNVVACCKVCNWMKSDMSQQEFIDHCNRISLKHK